jgi:hypothetical protein
VIGWPLNWDGQPAFIHFWVVHPGGEPSGVSRRPRQVGNLPHAKQTKSIGRGPLGTRPRLRLRLGSCREIVDTTGADGRSPHTVFEVIAIDPPAFDGAYDNSPIARLVNLIIHEALFRRATEGRIEPQADRFQVSYRVNGELVERDRPPRRLMDDLVERIRHLSTPSAGRIGVSNNGAAFDVAVRIETTVNGPSGVITL